MTTSLYTSVGRKGRTYLKRHWGWQKIETFGKLYLIWPGPARTFHTRNNILQTLRDREKGDFNSTALKRRLTAVRTLAWQLENFGNYLRSNTPPSFGNFPTGHYFLHFDKNGNRGKKKSKYLLQCVCWCALYKRRPQAVVIYFQIKRHKTRRCLSTNQFIYASLSVVIDFLTFGYEFVNDGCWILYWLINKREISLTHRELYWFLFGEISDLLLSHLTDKLDY